MPGGGPDIDISGQFPEPGPGEESAETGTAANPALVANGDGATPAAADGGEEGDDPYADDDVDLPRHVVVRINGVTMQHLASSFMGSILSLLLVFVGMVFFYGQCFTQ